MADADETAKEATRGVDPEVQAKYDEQKTGDPIGDADLRRRLDIPTTPVEQQRLDDQLFEAAFSPNIVERERFEEAATEGESSDRHVAEYAKYQEDVSNALIDRDPDAYRRARDALGMTTTPDDIAKFVDPSPSDVISAARQSQLGGIEVPLESALAEQVANVMSHIPPGAAQPTNTVGDPADGPAPTLEQHEALADARNDVVNATIDRDLDAFIDARNRLGAPATSEEIESFKNPSSSDVLALSRHYQLTGVDMPVGSALTDQVNSILAGNGPGPSTPTNTTGIRVDSGSTQGGTPSGSTLPAGGSSGTGDGEQVDRGDFDILSGQPNSTSGGTSLTSGTTAPATGGGSAPSAIDAALGNLQGGSPSEPEIPAPRDSGPGSTTGLSLPGGVGATGGGTTASPSPGPSTGGSQPDDDDFQVTAHSDGSSSTVDSDGNVYNNFANGSSSVTHPDGSAETYDSEGNQTGSAPPGTYNYEDTKAKATGTDDSDSGDEEDDGEAKPAEEEDEDDEEGMRDPDAADGSSLVAFDPVGGISMAGDVMVTNTGRGDLDGGLGPITGEVRSTTTAGPDVDPDSAAGAWLIGGADPLQQISATGGPAVTNTGRGDLIGGLGPIELPADDGIDPYALSGGVALSDSGSLQLDLDDPSAGMEQEGVFEASFDDDFG